jgi:hypothetical protein
MVSNDSVTGASATMPGSDERDEVPETKVLAIASHVCVHAVQLKRPMFSNISIQFRFYRLLTPANRSATGSLFCFTVLQFLVFL